MTKINSLVVFDWFMEASTHLVVLSLLSISNSISADFVLLVFLYKLWIDLIPISFIWLPTRSSFERISKNCSLQYVTSPVLSATMIPSPRSSRTKPNWSLCLAKRLIWDLRSSEICEILLATLPNSSTLSVGKALIELFFNEPLARLDAAFANSAMLEYV